MFLPVGAGIKRPAYIPTHVYVSIHAPTRDGPSFFTATDSAGNVSTSYGERQNLTCGQISGDYVSVVSVLREGCCLRHSTRMRS
jgi:hypothetical protein